MTLPDQGLADADRQDIVNQIANHSSDIKRVLARAFFDLKRPLSFSINPCKWMESSFSAKALSEQETQPIDHLSLNAADGSLLKSFDSS